MFKLISNCFNCFRYSEEQSIKNEYQNVNEINKNEVVFDQNSDQLIRNYADKMISQVNEKIDLANERKIKNNRVIFYDKFQNSDELVKHIKSLLKDNRTTDLKKEIVNFIEKSVHCQYRTDDFKKEN
ncbi:MAG: hypothetical protein Q8K60_09080 [Parachlamydiaceae bacterium]|nr:hypothetical protein [Parachlamydiaceae bacterium]